jgi:uncharacterized protein YgiM (DUF1202 family)
MSKIWYRLAIFFLLVVAGNTGCKSIKSNPEILYQTITISKQTYVHDKASLKSTRLETLREGERVAVLLEPKNKWLQIRTPSGVIGWVESRDALRREYFDEWENLSKKLEGQKPQSKGESADEANLRLRPGRDTVKVYKMNGAKTLDIFAMAHTQRPGSEPKAEKPAKKQTAVQVAEKSKSPSGKRRSADSTKYDTWYLVRTSDGVVGWLYSGLVTLHVPEELARYAEGKQIFAWHVLTVSKDDQGEHPWYLSIEREDDSNQDFDRVRVLYWNVARKRYELAYRIQNIIGVLPVEANRVEPGQQPSYKIRHLNEENPSQIIIDEYQMTGTQTKKINTSIESV